MEHIRIATYDVEDDTFDSLVESVHRELLRTNEEQPGFLRQSHVRLQGLTFLSVTIWGSREEADHAVVVAEAWGRREDSGAANFRSMPIRQQIRLMDGLNRDVPAAI
jgi:hypothetical protein